MPAKINLYPVLNKVDLLITEMNLLAVTGPLIRIEHRFRVPGTHCSPGEEISAVKLIHRGQEFPIRLSLAHRMLFDFLARHSDFPQSALQIELAIRSDDFCKRHGTNAPGGKGLKRKISRTAVKMYVQQIRLALALALQEACLSIDPERVLVKQKTVGNEVGIQLKARFQWIHHYLSDASIKRPNMC